MSRYWNDGGKLSDQAAEIAALRARVAELARDWAVADERDKVSRKLLTHAEAQVAELSASLKETAAFLQAIVKYWQVSEREVFVIGGDKRTVGEILDDANKALEPPATQDG